MIPKLERIKEDTNFIVTKIDIFLETKDYKELDWAFDAITTLVILRKEYIKADPAFVKWLEKHRSYKNENKTA